MVNDAQLEVVWSCSLEARGDAPGLSSYVGRSTLCGCMEALEALTYRDMERIPNRAQARIRWRNAAGQVCKPSQAGRAPKVRAIKGANFAKWPPLTPETSAAILALLHKGVSYNGIVTTLGTRGIVCSRDQARKVGRDHAIVRGRVAA
jgi:hypothetical protein